MKMLSMVYLLLSLLSINFSSAGDADDQVIAFNDLLVQRLKASQTPFEAYWSSLAPWYAGERLERPPVNKSFDEVRKTHQRIYAELLDVEVPEKEYCKEFYEAVLSFLIIDREIIAAYETALKYVFANNPATKRSDINQVESTVNPILARQEAVLEQISVLQEKMAERHGYTLKAIERMSIAASETD